MKKTFREDDINEGMRAGSRCMHLVRVPQALGFLYFNFTKIQFKLLKSWIYVCLKYCDNAYISSYVYFVNILFNSIQPLRMFSFLLPKKAQEKKDFWEHKQKTKAYPYPIITSISTTNSGSGQVGIVNGNLFLIPFLPLKY